ncbi:methyl-accepting chemotaxis protein [Nocardioides sp. J2M5]|uniref:methyl-accepting chemotaxis protein n=1 Tax=Nocardioides palaemonis TaxID=2829810 RepID=UPI001BA57B61|nr:methyl-accepting chemotaxis protein [Nocardioides palaemonis]MBS2940165.1 methyl-accepting chemotaxis protein [Nocardioides palaemonis]
MTAILTPPATRSAAASPRTTRRAPGTDALVASRRGPVGRFKDLATSRKLLAGFLAVVLLMIGVGAFAISRLGAAQDRLDSMYVDSMQATLWLTDTEQHMTAMTDAFHDAALSGRDASVSDLEATIAKEDAALDKSWGLYTATDMTGREKARDAFDAALADWRTVRDDTLVPLIAAGRADEVATTLQNDLATPEDAAGAALGDLVQIETDVAQATIDDARSGYHTARNLILALLAAATALAVGLAVALGRMVSRPLQRTVEVLEEVASGRLDARLEIDSADEVGRMGVALNGALAKLASAMGQMDANARSLASASEELSSVSGQMSGSASESSSQAGLVSAAAEQVSRNVQTVATGTEEMSASIREIAQNASNAAGVAAQAVVVAESTNATVAKLGDSSAEVGNVIKVINSIAEQTNLLALNATIEAARAGEAGKGFAVVANEVKELAQETGKATEDIGRRIEAIQADTEAAVAAIAEIAEIIGQINDTQATIASAVEEQTATTNEMSRNVAEAATGSSDIAANVTGVARSASDTQAAANSTSQSADELARMAAEMRSLVGQFQF